MPDEQQDHQAAKQDEAHEAEKRRAPPGAVVYRAIYREGEEELERRSEALAWSGLAAGMSMGFSFLTEALLHAHLPDAPWRPLVTKLGYSVGFLIVILGRQQLFTENTLTVILPLLKERSLPVLGNVLRLWGLVLAANLVGALLFARALTWWPVVPVGAWDALAAVSREAALRPPLEVFAGGVFAGWLIALMVWLLPFAETARVGVILILTYVIGLASFSHVIAGATEAFYAAAIGQVTWTHAVAGYTLPALAGNTLGGVALVAALAHAQFVQASAVGDE